MFSEGDNGQMNQLMHLLGNASIPWLKEKTTGNNYRCKCRNVHDHFPYTFGFGKTAFHQYCKHHRDRNQQEQCQKHVFHTVKYSCLEELIGSQFLIMLQTNPLRTAK